MPARGRDASRTEYGIATIARDVLVTDRTVNRGAAANPLLPVQTQGPRDGPLPTRSAFCEVSPANLTVRTVKQAEDGNGMILRLAETAGRHALNAWRMDSGLSPCPCCVHPAY